MSAADKLSPRELEVFTHIVNDGMTPREMADAMKVSDKTIYTHISEILRKLDCKDVLKMVVRHHRGKL